MTGATRFLAVALTFFGSFAVAAEYERALTTVLSQAIQDRKSESASDDASPELRRRIDIETRGVERARRALEARLQVIAKTGWGLHFFRSDGDDPRAVGWLVRFGRDQSVIAGPFELDDALFPWGEGRGPGPMVTWSDRAVYLPVLEPLRSASDAPPLAFVGVQRVEFAARRRTEGAWPASITRGEVIRVANGKLLRAPSHAYSVLSTVTGVTTRVGFKALSHGPFFEVLTTEDDACFESGSSRYLVRGPEVPVDLSEDGAVRGFDPRARRAVEAQCTVAGATKPTSALSDVAFALACRRLLGEPPEPLISSLVEPALRVRRCVDASFLRAWAAQPSLP